MSDLPIDGAAVDDTALFADVTNRETQPPAVVDPAPVTTIQPTTTQPAADPAHEPAIPPARLREEAERARKAERELDELRGRLAAMEERNKPAPKPEDEIDYLINPEGFFKKQISPLQEQMQQQLQEVREYYSRQSAIRDHGADVVKAAEDAVDAVVASLPLEQQAAARAERAKAVDPIGGMVKWHKQQKAMQEVGPDPAAYKTRVLEEAMKDPEFQKRVIEAARGQAQQNGNTITRPAVSALPSLSKVGAVALPDGQDEASDNELFTSITKRRRG